MIFLNKTMLPIAPIKKSVRGTRTVMKYNTSGKVLKPETARNPFRILTENTTEENPVCSKNTFSVPSTSDFDIRTISLTPNMK